MPKDVLVGELKGATKELGIDQKNLTLFNFRVRRFPEFRQEILEEMVKISRELQPDLVLLPASTDTHQDHQVISQEGFRAFKRTSMLGYEIPWNNSSFVASGYVKLEAEHLDRKVRALSCYKSQSFRSYAKKEFIEALALVRGTQIGSRYAELFESIRWTI